MPDSTTKKKQIIILPDGPYEVKSNIPLVHKSQIVSEYGEPLTWQKNEDLQLPSEPYYLCRCGHSSDKPFCDWTHQISGFDGTETADTGSTIDRQETYPGGTKIVVKSDASLCMNSGFCGTRFAHISRMVAESDDPQVRAQMMRMIEHCPSGSLTYSIRPGEEDVEPDLPEQVAVTTEITSSGPINGPLWVTGNIPVERADGQPLETRNRVTLCSCGQSHNKPLCDGTHRGDR
jgi:CDGSH-type Zn-finger protein